MTATDSINMLLDMALDDNTPDDAKEALLRATEAFIYEAAEEEPAKTRSDDEAWEVYCAGYDGRTVGVAERRQVMFPDMLGGASDMGWSHTLLRALARRERMQDDVMYAHCAALMAPRPLHGA